MCSVRWRTRLNVGFLFQHSRCAGTDRRLDAVRQTGEQPGQHHLKLHMIFRHIDRAADLLFQRGQLERKAIAAPDFFVDLKNLSVFRTDTAEPRLQAAGRFFLPKLVGDGDHERLSQCHASTMRWTPIIATEPDVGPRKFHLR